MNMRLWEQELVVASPGDFILNRASSHEWKWFAGWQGERRTEANWRRHCHLLLCIPRYYFNMVADVFADTIGLIRVHDSHAPKRRSTVYSTARTLSSIQYMYTISFPCRNEQPEKSWLRANCHQSAALRAPQYLRRVAPSLFVPATCTSVQTCSADAVVIGRMVHVHVAVPCWGTLRVEASIS